MAYPMCGGGGPWGQTDPLPDGVLGVPKLWVGGFVSEPPPPPWLSKTLPPSTKVHPGAPGYRIIGTCPRSNGISTQSTEGDILEALNVFQMHWCIFRKQQDESEKH